MELKAMATELLTMKNQARKLNAELEALEAKGEAAPAERKEELNRLIEDGQAKQAAYDAEVKRQGFLAAEETPEPKARERATSAGRPKTLGRQFVESEEYKALRPGGKKVTPVTLQPWGQGLDFDVKLLREGLAAAGGSAVFSDRDTVIHDNARLRPVQLLDVLNISPTNSSSIDFIQITGFTNNAAETAEWDGTSNYAALPESDATFALVNSPVQTLGHYIRASRRILDDAPALQNLMDTKVMNGVRVRLESQILSGNGSAPNLRGILNTSGIQTRVMSASAPTGRGQLTTDSKADTIRRAITDIRLAFYDPNAIVLNPADGEALELLKDSTNNYLMIYDPVSLRIWRVRVIESAAITALTGLVGDFQTGATLYIRDDVTTEVAESVSDDRIRDAVRIIGEMRAALAVTDAPAFEKLTLI